jgi:dihydroflavonol-4-reductase
MTDRVLVTGANGHIGFNIVQQLLDKGYQVRAMVRDRNDPAKAGHLQNLNIELVEAVSASNAKEVMDPSTKGAENILRAAAAAGIKKVVSTSSVAAVGGTPEGGPERTEEDWNEDASDPYSMAKTEGERVAWHVAEECGLNLVTINPSMVMGPGFHRHTPSTRFLGMLEAGMMPMALPFGIAIVDVRDVASAHILAYESEVAKGRYIVSTANMQAIDIIASVGRQFPDIKAPTKIMPKFLVSTMPFMDFLMHLFMRIPRSITKEVLAEIKGKEFRVSTLKLQNELGWQPKFDVDTCLKDTINWMRQNKISD